MKKLFLTVFILIMAFSVIAATQTKSPTTCSGWATCSSANVPDNVYSTATPNMQGAWRNYNFNVSGNTTVTGVVVQVDFKATRSNGYANVKVSSDGGASYGPTHQIGGNTVEQTYLINVSSDATWNNVTLQNSNFKVNVTCVKIGSGKNPQCQIDWIPVIVTTA